MKHRPTISALLLFGAIATGAFASDRFDAFEKTIPELQEAMERGEVTSRELVRQYLERIEAFDQKGPALNAMIYLNPHALEDAEALDRERAERGPRGPLHGIPVILKDNYDTRDMPTTASSIALAGFVPADDGYQVRKLREAGAVFVGKSNMHELARGITTISSLGGQTRNPYDPERNPGGSSGGTGAAIAANFAAVGMGSDTCGSIRIPSANNNLFGLRVTQGLSSRDGIIPLSHTQDVGGPLARAMIDLVLVLDATVGPDPADPQTRVSEGRIPDSYTAFLKEDALRGVRLGLLKSYLKEEPPEETVTEVVKQAVELMREQGAETVEVDIENLGDLLEDSGVIGMEFKLDLKRYLEDAEGAPVRSLGEILDRGLYHDALGERFRSSNQAEQDAEDYPQALARRERVKRALLETLETHDLDALVYPTLRVEPALIGERQFGSSCSVSAHSGLPAISIPAGFTEDGLPVGVELLGRAFAEPQLIAMAYAYEQAAAPRKPPARTPSLLSDTLTFELDLVATGAEMLPPVDSTASARGHFWLDRPTQTLHYELVLSGLLDSELEDVKLHRAVETTGPIVASLGRGRRGRVPIRNRDLDPLVEGRLYVAVYTKTHPQGQLRGWLTPRAK